MLKQSKIIDPNKNFETTVVLKMSILASFSSQTIHFITWASILIKICATWTFPTVCDRFQV